MSASPFYADDRVTLYLGDCLTLADVWTTADVLVMDPPYGRAWKQNAGLPNSQGKGRGKAHRGIAGDASTATRDAVLKLWGPDRLAVVFGDLLVSPPPGAVQALVYRKAADAGVKGARAGFRRDLEAVYLVGPWPAGVGGRTSLLTSQAWTAGPTSAAYRYGHPHAKPVDLLEELVGLCPPGVVADPCAGSGSTLVAARNLGRPAIGVELDRIHATTAARRLAQGALDLADL